MVQNQLELYWKIYICLIVWTFLHINISSRSIYTNVQNTFSNMQHSQNLRVVFMHKNNLMLHCENLKWVPDKNNFSIMHFLVLRIHFAHCHAIMCILHKSELKLIIFYTWYNCSTSKIFKCISLTFWPDK